MIEKKKTDKAQQDAAELEKRAEEDKQREAQQQKDRMKLFFDNEKIEIGEEVVTIAFRLPNGSRRQRNFKKSYPTSVLYDYVSLMDVRGFENENNNFRLTAGFPAQNLDPHVLIKDHFPDSDQELVHVKEIEL